MIRNSKIATVGIALLLAGVGAALAPPARSQPPACAPAQMAPGAAARNLEQMQFITVPGIPTCARAAVQSGDPMATPFILVLQVSRGCTIPWHWHSATESLMVAEGNAEVTMAGGGKPVVLRSGGFAQMPSRHIHQMRCLQQPCTLYLHSDAAFDIHYVDARGNEISPQRALSALRETTTMAQR